MSISRKPPARPASKIFLLQVLFAAGLSAGLVPVSAQEAEPLAAGQGAAAFGARMEDERLARFNSQIASVEHVGSVIGNSATHVRTGNNVITEGSLANAVGFPTVIQNTGANVLIQSSTTLNVQLR